MQKRRPSSSSGKPWHRGSIFGPGRRRLLDRNARARWRYVINRHARAGRITAKGAWVLQALEQHLSREGRCDPSHARLAAEAEVGERTVERTLMRARALGLVDWDRRIDRVAGGWRAEQTSNAYVLLGEGAELTVAAAPPPASVTRAEKQDSSFTDRVMMPVPLAGFAERFAAKLQQERATRRANRPH
jgi:hypothetical protein